VIPPYHVATFSGLYVNLLAPAPESISLYDIAHALSNEPRFGGHTSKFYSVAQHSVLVSNLVPQEYALEGLLHDAHEAYCKDLPAPLKDALSKDGRDTYRSIEKALDTVIRLKFGLPSDVSSQVAEADMTARASEAKVLMKTGMWRDWFIKLPETVYIGKALTPHSAETAFIKRFKELAKERGQSA